MFRPTLVANPNDGAACINGDFIYQRKRKKDEWEDINDIPLSRLRAGEGVRITLGAKEVLALVRHLAALYRYYAANSLPKRKVHLIKLDLNAEDADAFQRLDVRRLVSLGRRAGVDIISQLLDWLSDQENAAQAVGQLRVLGSESLQRLSTAAGIASVEAALTEWESNRNNKSEEFWQKLLSRYAFVLSQAFSFPLVIIKAKAYLGGKRLDNTGGHLADYLAANPSTRNPVIIEIKTPGTPLLQKHKYRDDIYAPSEDLTGGAAQVLNYRQNLLADRSLTRGYEDRLEILSPHCMLLIGDTAQLTDEDQRRSFELTRAGYRDVLVITYDELFGRLRALLEAFGHASGIEPVPPN